MGFFKSIFFLGIKKLTQSHAQKKNRINNLNIIQIYCEFNLKKKFMASENKQNF